MSDLHEHLSDDELEEVAEAHLSGAELPACTVCAVEVSELARYLMTARAAAGQRAEAAGNPGVEAIRELRRSTYARRALQQVVRLVTPATRRVHS